MPKFRIESKNGHHSVITAQFISKGETILELSGILLSVPTKYTVQIDRDRHLHPFSNQPERENTSFRYINHSCEPNAFFNIPEMKLVAGKDIEPGQEVTYNYNSTEYEMAVPFKCNCGSSRCLQDIRGFRFLTAEQQKEILPYLSPYLLSVR